MGEAVRQYPTVVAREEIVPGGKLGKNQVDSSMLTNTLIPSVFHVASSGSSVTIARCTTRANKKSQVACKYCFFSRSRHKCSGASKSSFRWAESDCNTFK